MPNLSDKRLDRFLTEAIKSDTTPSNALKAEIWNGLLAKLEEQAAYSHAETLPIDVCVPVEKLTFKQRVTGFIWATLEQSGAFLFADVIPFERARQQTLPQSYYWMRWNGNMAVA